MTEDDICTAEILNELYAAECAGILARVGDLGCFVPGSSARQTDVLRRLCSASAEHRAWLIAEIESSHGALRPATMDPRTAGLHYVGFASLLPRINADIEELLVAYREAGMRRGLTASAAGLLQRISARYRELLLLLPGGQPATAGAPPAHE